MGWVVLCGSVFKVKVVLFISLSARRKGFAKVLGGSVRFMSVVRSRWRVACRCGLKVFSQWRVIFFIYVRG